MKKKKNKLYQRILLVASLVGLIVLGCAKRPPLEDIGDRLSYPSLLWPIDFGSNSDSQYFLLLNTNALIDYKTGSAVLFQKKTDEAPKKKTYIRDFPANLFPVSVAQSKYVKVKVDNEDKNLVAIGFAGRNPVIRFYYIDVENDDINFIELEKEQLDSFNDSEYCDTDYCKFWGNDVNKFIDQMGFFTYIDRKFFYYTINPQKNISRIRIHEVLKEDGLPFKLSKSVIKIPEDLEKPEDFKKHKEMYELSYASPSLIKVNKDNQYFVFLPQGVSGDDPPDLPDSAYEYMENQDSKHDEAIRRASLGIVSLKDLLDNKTIVESKNALSSSTKYLPLAWDKNGLAYSDSNKNEIDKDSFSFKKKFWTSYSISKEKSGYYTNKGQTDLLIVQKVEGSSASDILRVTGFNELTNIDFKSDNSVIDFKNSKMEISLYSKARDNKTLDNTPNAINTMSMLKISDKNYLPFWVRRFSNTTYETFGLGKSWLGLNAFKSGNQIEPELILQIFKEEGPESCIALDENIYCINFGNSHLSKCSFDEPKRSFSCQIIEVE